MANIPPDAPRAVSPLDDDDALPPGTRFGELEIIRVVGIGGFGIVYLAQDHALEREVALKEYMPGSLAGRGAGKHVSVRSDAHAQTYALGLRSFVNEARLLARFNHPSLVKVYRFWEENGTAYMVMPFLQGRTLRDVRRSMSMAPDQPWIVSVIRPLLDALEQLHREAVYHRDIAPDNILLPPNELPVLLDFGAARRAISDRTQTFTAILKPSYAPIEQYADSVAMRQGPWTDIYALGAVVYYLIKGSPPPPATTRALHEDLPMLSGEALAGATPEFLAIVDWMLSIRPADRPQSVSELREVLEGRAPVPPRKVVLPPVRPVATPPPMDQTQRMPRYQPEEPTQVMPSSRTFAATQIGTGNPSGNPSGVDPDETVVIRRGPREDPVTMLVPRTPPPPAPPTPPRLVAPPPAASSRRGLWLVMLACLLLLVALGALMLMADHSGRREESSAAPVTPAGSAAVAGVPAASAVAAADPAASAVAEAEPVPAMVTEPPAVDATAPSDLPSETSDALPPIAETPVVTPSRSASRDKPVVADARKPKATKSSESPPYSVKERPVETQPGRADDSGRTRPVAQSTPTTPVVPQAPASPREACGGRVFIAFDLCMEDRCHEPRYTAHPQCVRVHEIEERRKRPDY